MDNGEATPTRLGNQNPKPKNGSILLSGGAGFLGFHLCQKLLDEGRKVIVWDNLSGVGSAARLAALKTHPSAKELLQFEEIDIRQRIVVMTRLAAINHSQPVDWIVHGAAQNDLEAAEKRPFEDFDVNAAGTLNLLEAARRSCSSCRFLYLSSLELNLDSGHPGNLKACRASRQAAENYMTLFRSYHKLKTTVIRLGRVYGIGHQGHHQEAWLSDACQKAIHGKTLSLPGNGSWIYDYLEVSDFVAGMMALMESEANEPVLELAGGAENSADFVTLIEKVSELTGQTLSAQCEAEEENADLKLVSESERLRELVGWTPKVSLDEGMAILLRALNNDNTFAGNSSATITDAEAS